MTRRKARQLANAIAQQAAEAEAEFGVPAAFNAQLLVKLHALDRCEAMLAQAEADETQPWLSSDWRPF